MTTAPTTAPHRPSPPPAVLGMAQVARRAGVGLRAARDWVDSGRLPGYRVGGSGARRVAPADLEAFLLRERIYPVLGEVTLVFLGVASPLVGRVTLRAGRLHLRIAPEGSPHDAGHDYQPGGAGRYSVRQGTDAAVALLREAGFHEIQDRRPRP